MNSLLIDIGIVIVVATVFAYFARFLKQPLILAYLVAGIVIGPVGLGLITNYENIAVLSELGIAFMLFIVGLELDIKKLRHLGFVAFAAGIGQIVFTFTAGYLIALIFFSRIVSTYIALALTFSSTIIVVKIYSDKNELGTLHGRISLGILLAQDFIAIIALALLSGMGNGAAVNPASFAVLKGMSLFVVALIAGFVLKYVFKPVARSQELLFMSAVAWCFALVYLSARFEFSIAIGAFLAGISLASLPYNIEIIGKTRSLRDFFAVIFFVALGMQIVFSNISNIFMIAILFSAFVMIGNPLIVMTILSLLGYKSRTSFLSAISIAQISEFSLILVALGFNAGILSQEVVSLIAIVALVTFTISTYMITYDSKLYEWLAPVARLFERKNGHKLEYIPIKKYDAVLFGCDRMGGAVLKTLNQLKYKALVVDYNPEIIRECIAGKQPAIYGDMGDLEILQRIPLRSIKLIVSTIPDVDDNKMIIRRTKQVNKNIIIFATAGHADDALELYEAGADYVILPRFLSGERVSMLIEEVKGNFNKIFKYKLNHIGELKKIRH
jgi:Kef-type K+ transport system membrane component KefB